jgi:ADP-dependent NAD(P)H-hydrate dehydratase / NAD(P)H-hydrate epimerase
VTVLTAEEMREVDRLTIERGIPGLILMENAANRFVDVLVDEFELAAMKVLVVCGKGNNGGDGFAIARQLHSRELCRSVELVALYPSEELKGDAAANWRMLQVAGVTICPDLTTVQEPDLVIDAILGTGQKDNPKSPAKGAIEAINAFSSDVIRVSVDMPSGLSFEPSVQADLTVTFVAPKPNQVLSPTYSECGRLVVVPVGSPDDLIRSTLHLASAEDFADLFDQRPPNSNKGMYGHVLAVGGSFGKSGAPAMCGLGAYRSGAGLVTVGIPKSALVPVAATRPELMTEPLEETGEGTVKATEAGKLLRLLEKMTVLAVGPGLGTSDEAATLVARLFSDATVPGIFDADALNVLAGKMPDAKGKVRILTPHPGEMSRLAGISTKDVQADRLASARKFAAEHSVTVVLKGDRTIIAFPEGEAWVNPTGSPSMATGGTGDILTGMIAGMVAQHPQDWKRAVVAAVWLHGRCGELAADQFGEQYTLALDLLEQLPEAIREVRGGYPRGYEQ